MKQDNRYGAVIERGKIVSASGGGYVVKSLTRDGITTLPLAAAGTHTVGETVYYCMFDDGEGKILDSGAGSVTSVNGKTGNVALDYSDVGAAAAGHNHDGSYLKLSGGTMTGTIKLAATGLETANEGGYSTNEYGNFRHLRNDTSDNWNLKSYAGSTTFGVKFESGEVTTGAWKATPIDIDYGGTGAATAAEARTNLGITPANIGAATSGHNHDGTYLKLTGGTLSSGLTATRLSIANSGDPQLQIKASADAGYTGLMGYTYTNHRFYFHQKNSSADSYREVYSLPTTDSGLSSDMYYSILTTKTVGTQSSASTSSDVSVASGTYTKLTQLVLEAGTYIIIAHASFTTNTSGLRFIAISTTSGSSAGVNRWATWRGMPVSGAYTQGEAVTVVAPSGSGTYYLNAYQTSGSALNVSGGLLAVRIK